MASTFMGLETSKRGLSVQQSALYTTGHNISNANTIGYSRQTVQITPTQGFPGIGMNSPQMPGFLGTGAEAGSITRVRDQFIDTQFRQETNKLGYWGAKTEAISQLEDIITEPSTFGLNKAYDDFYKSLQDLSTAPESNATRQVATEKANHLADTFNYIHTQITQVQSNLKNEINVETKNVNSILKQIAQLNDQIANIEPNGYLPNDLYDARDNLVDQLSQYMSVSVKQEPNGGNAKAIAEGTYNIFMKLADGTEVQLVNKREAATITAQTAADLNVGTPSTNFDTSDTFTSFSQFNVVMGDPAAGGTGTAVKMTQLAEGKGILKSLVENYGYLQTDPATGATSTVGLTADTMRDLDTLAKEFVTEFNAIHAKGFTYETKNPDGTVLAASVAGGKFFDTNDGSTTVTASNIAVSKDILADYNKIAASSGVNEAGNGKNTIELSNLKTKVLKSLNNASAQTFYQGMVGTIGVLGEQATRMLKNTETLQLTIANNRASVSSVSLDEEMTNMVKYQQAYNASARMMTVMDETLEKIINGMGRVGL